MMMNKNIEEMWDNTKMVDIANCLLKTYLIGSIESPGKGDDGKGWRQTITPHLNNRGIFCFDPTKEETKKVGMETYQLQEKLNGWQRSGNWNLFTENMRKIWLGQTVMREDPDTGEAQLTHLLGDIDYVSYSDFLIWTLHEGDKLGGTIAELAIGFYLNKPCYLVTDVPKSQINKSLLYFVLDSGHGRGKIFKNYGELLGFLDGEYKLSVIGE